MVVARSSFPYKITRWSPWGSTKYSWVEQKQPKLFKQKTSSGGSKIFFRVGHNKKHQYSLVWAFWMKKIYFNRINFREIKFRVFANFCHFREIKTRENARDCWLAKLNPPENFWKLHFRLGNLSKFSIYGKKWLFSAVYRLIREIKSTRNFSNPWFAKLNPKNFANFLAREIKSREI